VRIFPDALVVVWNVHPLLTAGRHVVQPVAPRDRCEVLAAYVAATDAAQVWHYNSASCVEQRNPVPKAAAPRCNNQHLRVRHAVQVLKNGLLRSDRYVWTIRGKQPLQTPAHPADDSRTHWSCPRRPVTILVGQDDHMADARQRSLSKTVKPVKSEHNMALMNCEVVPTTHIDDAHAAWLATRSAAASHRQLSRKEIMKLASKRRKHVGIAERAPACTFRSPMRATAVQS